MPRKKRNLHGSAPDDSPLALLLIDVINDLEFPEGGQLLRFALPAARRIAALKRRAKANGVPVIYVNDNFGRWQSDFKKQVNHCLDDGVRGEQIARLLAPDEDDYFVLKPKHSGFFSTTLDILLDHLGSQTLILTGFAGDICVLFSANDAYMRDFELVVPSDCIASETSRANQYALDQMKRFLKADTRQSASVQFNKLRRKAA
jgi:nicotinamidase-related amidase